MPNKSNKNRGKKENNDFDFHGKEYQKEYQKQAQIAKSQMKEKCLTRFSKFFQLEL